MILYSEKRENKYMGSGPKLSPVSWPLPFGRPKQNEDTYWTTPFSEADLGSAYCGKIGSKNYNIKAVRILKYSLPKSG